jgi:hypothetical protein
MKKALKSYREALNKKKPFDPRNDFEREVDAIGCYLHNAGANLMGNTQDSDLEWFARNLYQHCGTFGYNYPRPNGPLSASIDNAEFEKLGLLPDRPWTNKQWETLAPGEQIAWLKFAEATIHLLPKLAERIGHRFMEQSKALRVAWKANHP